MTHATWTERTPKLLNGLVVGDCLGTQMLGWDATSFDRVFDGPPELLVSWPSRVRRLSPGFRRRLREPTLYGWHTQLLLAGMYVGGQTANLDWQSALTQGFEERGWRGYPSDFLRLVHQKRLSSHVRTQQRTVFGLGILGLLPHLTNTTIEVSLDLVGRLTDDPISRWLTTLVYLLAQKPEVVSVEALLDDSLAITPVDADIIQSIKSTMNSAISQSKTDSENWWYRLRQVRRPAIAEPFVFDTDAEAELCRFVLAIHLAVTSSLSPMACLQEIAMWGGQSDFRCAAMGAWLAHESNNDWTEVGAASGMERPSLPMIDASPDDVMAFWTRESRLCVREGAFVEDLTAERRSGLLREHA